MIPYIILSISRILCSIHGYSAPLTLYRYLSQVELPGVDREVNVCVGKEWYRFGSSFFLPSERVHLQFIKSGFDGLLPQVRQRKWVIDSHSAEIMERG